MNPYDIEHIRQSLLDSADDLKALGERLERSQRDREIVEILERGNVVALPADDGLAAQADYAKLCALIGD